MLITPTDKVMHPTYLPFTEEQLRRHFAPLIGSSKAAADPDETTARPDYLRYYRESATRHLSHDGSTKPTAMSHQIERDERFWIAGALLDSFYPEAEQVGRLTQLLRRTFGDVPPIDGVDTWADCLKGTLHLYFEVSVPSPRSYKEWLKDNLEERVLMPYKLALAQQSGHKLEGATKLDALLIAEQTGFAVAFEGKVLSDLSPTVSYDAMRNQLARTIDVLLDEHENLGGPLRSRQPDQTCVALLTPRIFKESPETRLYGHLYRTYKSSPQALASHLAHREKTEAEWKAITRRLGWLTFEDCQEAVPGSCRWLPAPTEAQSVRP
jgi:hypothetical protein